MSLIYCPECGKEVSEKATSCPNCGTPINDSTSRKFCLHCGKQIDKDCVVCPHCGKQVADLSNNSGPTPIVINNNNSASSSASASNVGYAAPGAGRYGKPVNKVLYCILTLFLGGIGVHKFYSGKIMAGIIYLLFCWTGIPAIIALIELIVALFKPADENGNIWF